MKKKIFEKKFPDQAEATRYLDDHCWKYVGRKGLIKKYHCYEAVSVWRSLDGIVGYVDRDNIDEFLVKVYPDGFTCVYVTGNSTLSGISNFPESVWSSYDSYMILQEIVHIVAGELPNHIVKVEREKVFKLTVDGAELSFSHPKYLYEYAIKNGITSSNKSYDFVTEELKSKGYL